MLPVQQIISRALGLLEYITSINQDLRNAQINSKVSRLGFITPKIHLFNDLMSWGIKS